MNKMKIKYKLRRPTKSDLKSFHKNKNDKTIAKNMFGPKYPLTLNQAKKDLNKLILDNKKENTDIFVIDIDGEATGMIGLWEIIPQLKAKIGYFIGKDYRGKGITTEAIKEIVKYGFKKYKLRRIYGNVKFENKASARVLEKAGFKLEGIQKKNGFKYRKYFDEFLYARVK
ncbi:GNAT family N-acetyltransferase [archaeon]|jgi:[ribosomal protein S5]-alanine N-acetyltransferase|nr:GNAT family N-acetyltransferase [archaeon]